MNEMITKPMSVERQEFIDNLLESINSCNLPLFVIEPILQDMLASVKAAVQEQYKVEKEQYEQLLAKSNKAE